MTPLADALLEGYPDPVLILDGARRVVLANGAARALLGANLVGRELALSLRHPAILSAVDAVLADGSARYANFVQKVPVERVFTAHVSAVPHDVYQAMLVLSDVTSVHRAESMRADFVANVSHELRSPLAALIGFIETLRYAARDDSDARDRFLEIMQREADRMRRLIGDLLSLSRIESDEHVAPQGQVDLAKLVRQASESLAVPAKARNIGIDCEIADGICLVEGDADQLTQVLQNLIDNAVKYGREGSRVRVKLAQGERESPQMLMLAVEDSGEGIPAEDIPRLTERFYRVDKARSRDMGGTGLGLAIVKHIVNRHKGRLVIQSVIGQGSKFMVFLPTITKP